MKNYALYFHYNKDDDDAVYLYDTLEEAKTALFENLNPALYAGGCIVDINFIIGKDCTDATIFVKFIDDSRRTTTERTDIRIVRVYD